MFKKLTLFGATLALGAGAVVPATAADAQRWGGDRWEQEWRGDRGDRGFNGRQFRGRDSFNRYRAREKCRDGDGGTIIGAIAGGLLGRTVAGRGDRTIGTVLGAAGGALAGRAIDRADRPGYCRR